MGKSGKSQTIIFNGFYGSNTEILALKALAFLVFAADQDAYLNSGLFRLNKGGEGGVGGVGTNAVHGSSRRVSFSSAVLSDSPDNDNNKPTTPADQQDCQAQKQMKLCEAIRAAYGLVHSFGCFSHPIHHARPSMAAAGEGSSEGGRSKRSKSRTGGGDADVDLGIHVSRGLPHLRRGQASSSFDSDKDNDDDDDDDDISLPDPDSDDDGPPPSDSDPENPPEESDSDLPPDSDSDPQTDGPEEGPDSEPESARPSMLLGSRRQPRGPPPLHQQQQDNHSRRRRLRTNKASNSAAAANTPFVGNAYSGLFSLQYAHKIVGEPGRLVGCSVQATLTESSRLARNRSPEGSYRAGERRGSSASSVSSVSSLSSVQQPPIVYSNFHPLQVRLFP
jgi:hypothetical protein